MGASCQEQGWGRGVGNFMTRKAMCAKLNFFAALLLSAGLTVLHAWGDLCAQSKYAGESFSRGVGARGLAMGSAFSSLTEGASSLYWNSAGMADPGSGPLDPSPGQAGATVSMREIMAMHSESFGGEVDYDYIGFVQPLSEEPRKSAFGVGVIRLGVSGFQETALPDSTEPPGPNNRPYVVNTFSVADYAFLFGYARGVRRDLRLGGNVKVLHRSLYKESATGFGFDLGMLYAPASLSPLQIGVSAQDVTTSFLSYSTGKSERIRPTIRFGISTASGIRVWYGSVILATDLVFRFEDRGSQVDNFAIGAVSGTYHIGGEYTLDSEHLRGVRLGLRGGLDEEVPAVGAGVGFGRFDFDYAWLGKVDEDLGTSNRVSMTVSL